MKLIQAMKKIKDLQMKASDLRTKVKDNCAHLDYEKGEYGDEQQKVVDGWLQAHEDIMKEILKLRVAIQKTNLATEVEIDFSDAGGKKCTKSIAAWIHRRRDLAKTSRDMWASLTDRGLQEGVLRPTTDKGEPVKVEVIRYYDPQERDKRLELLRSEPLIIDSTLETVNAVTDLVESDE